MDHAFLALVKQANPWLERPELGPALVARHVPAGFVPRRTPRADAWPVRGRAHLVVGARQVGKSSFLWQRFQAWGRVPLLLNAEEPAVRLWCRSPTILTADLKGLVGPDVPILLEEAQHLEEAGLLIKGLVDGGLPNPVFVTGSSSYHLHARTRESLAGRATRVTLHPFSLDEVCADLAQRPPLLRADQARARAFRQAVWGGYPAAWLSTSPDSVLAELRDAFVLRDASDLFRVQHLDAFRRLLRLIAGQVGSLVNVAEWATICGISRPTVDAYLDILEQSHLVRRVRPFVGGKRSELTHNPKVTFCDSGLRSAVLGRFEPFEHSLERGALLESWVAAELLKHLDPLAPTDELRYWRSKAGAEVDFVLERPDGLVGIEVKASLGARPALSRSARSFLDAYHPARFLVLTLGAQAEQTIGDTRVTWLGPEALTDALFGEG